MTSTERTAVLRRTRRLTWACYLVIALISIALFTREHARITRAALTVVGIAALAADLYGAYKFGVI